MTLHLHRDLATVRKSILEMGGMVEDLVRLSSEALVQRRPDVAHQVIQADADVDRQELEVDEECLKLLALHQPVAGDLRFITAVMKINNDLERIGDLASNLAQRALDLLDQPFVDAPLRFEEMTAAVRGMLRDSLDALVRGDAERARAVIAKDDEVDSMNREHFRVLEDRMKADPVLVEACVLYLSASRNLERMADLATNVAEDVVFMVDAVVLRHWRVTHADEDPSPAAGRPVDSPTDRS